MENIIQKIKSIKITGKDIIEGLTIGIVTVLSLLFLVIFVYALIDFMIDPWPLEFDNVYGLLSKIEPQILGEIIYSITLLILIILLIFSLIRVWQSKYFQTLIYLVSTFIVLIILSKFL